MEIFKPRSERPTCWRRDSSIPYRYDKSDSVETGVLDGESLQDVDGCSEASDTYANEQEYELVEASAADVFATACL